MLEFDFTLRYKPGKFMIFPDALSRVPATVAGIVKTVNEEEGRLFFEEAHIDLGKHNGHTETLRRMKDVFWNTKNHDIRSWISTCGCSFAKDGRRRRKRGTRKPLDLDRYPLKVVSADLYSWLCKVYFTLLDLYSDNIRAFQIYGKSAKAVILCDCGGEFVGLKDFVSLHRKTAAHRPQSDSRLERKIREIGNLCQASDISPLDAVLSLNDDSVETLFGEKRPAVDDLHAGDFCLR
jgi:hypothetical protein